MFPNAEGEAWLVWDSPSGLAIRWWDETKAGGAEPTEQEVIDAGNSQAFTDHMTVPKEVTNYQLRRALNASPAAKAQVVALINGSDDEDMKDGWAAAATFKQDNPLFQAGITQLGWTQQQVNNILILAATFD
jgi:hypothetical protein